MQTRQTWQLSIGRFWLASYLMATVWVGIAGALIPSTAAAITAKLISADKLGGWRGYWLPIGLWLLLTWAGRGV